MRHQVAGYKLNRNKGQRNSLRRTMIRQLFKFEHIHTTKAKAMSIRGEAEKLITIARNSDKGDAVVKMNARRLVSSKLGNDPVIVKKLFDDIGIRYKNRNGGYTRIYRLGVRQGDCAEMVRLELVEE
jgi:large subunit ribosomal protein L17